MNFKDRIKFLRIEKGLTQTNLASQFNKTESAARAWELGRTKPDADTLIKLAEYFGCTTDYLLGINDFRNREDIIETMEQEKNILSLINDLPFTLRSDVMFHLEQLLTVLNHLNKSKNSFSNIFLKVMTILEHLPTFLITIGYFSDEEFRSLINISKVMSENMKTLMESSYNIIDEMLDELYQIVNKPYSISTRIKLSPNGEFEEISPVTVSEAQFLTTATTATTAKG